MDICCDESGLREHIRSPFCLTSHSKLMMYIVYHIFARLSNENRIFRVIFITRLRSGEPEQ